MHRRKHILVVDDDRDFRDQLVACLKFSGYETSCANEGTRALAMMRNEHKPDVLVLDLKMDGMDGYEMRVAQLRDPHLTTIPTIVVTGYVVSPAMVVALRPDAFLMKPTPLRAVIDAIERALSDDRPR